MSRTSRLLRLAQKASQANSRSISTNGKGLGGAAQQAVGCATTNGAAPAPGPNGTHAAFQQTRGAALAAQALKVEPQVEVVPEIKIDLFGAVSAAEAEDGIQPGVFKNVDGHRFEDGRYAAFTAEITEFVPKERQYTDPVRTLAYGTDASFYRLNPKMVVKVHTEAEVRRILPIAKKHGVPITFRAAGTSLSGQAITDSVLLKLSHTGRNFRNYEIHGDGSTITVEPGLILGEVNRLLAAHKAKGGHPIQYKLGPDPSSVDSCMIGGVVSNNSSGMCCGVSQNTYHTLRDMRVVFADGTVLDTADPISRQSFLRSHRSLCDGVSALARRVQGDRELTNLIRRKFAIKCTTGYSLNALVDFPADDPIEVIKHLMIGSEGTLGFVSRATYNTVPEWPNKASAFIVFPDVRAACRAASILRDETAVDAVELFDRASLRECEADEQMATLVPDILGADPMAAALLIECRGRDADALQASIDEVNRALVRHGLPFGAKAAEPKALETYPFSFDTKGDAVWRRRKYRVRRGQDPGTFYYSVLDNGITSEEYWRVLDAADDLSFALFYYTGAASRAGMSYSGAVLGTPDGAWPEAHADRISAALDRAGIKLWELSRVDNSACGGAPLGLA
ncbi:glycolate dehydrogenase [Raphidocelis subcapitata]|uniref:D-lactate dehydrogenase (cytochrome) n=1 Tax=Raphidocelis subcapitata TaxID=307507 RepID=A0A2V0PAR4_9CHLO|nr:glycolate dehydrogenase [Raphidocelis subcapitata]|eukprot:GBF96948.1 glycolate dehydrogenase [Raphidocelis subcapitata]